MHGLQPDVSGWFQSDLVDPQAPSLWSHILTPCKEMAANLKAVDWSSIPYTWTCDPTDRYGDCHYGAPRTCIGCTPGSYECGIYSDDYCPDSGKCDCYPPDDPYYGETCPANGVCSNNGYIARGCPAAPPDPRKPTALVECHDTIRGPDRDDMGNAAAVIDKFCTSMAHPTSSSDHREL